MIDTDSRGLIGPDEPEASRQDLWLSSCCQMKRRLKPPCSAKTHTHLRHLFDHPKWCPFHARSLQTHTHRPALTQEQIKLREQSSESEPLRTSRPSPANNILSSGHFVAHVSNRQSFNQWRLHYSDCKIQSRQRQEARRRVYFKNSAQIQFPSKLLFCHTFSGSLRREEQKCQKVLGKLTNKRVDKVEQCPTH